MGQRFSSEWRCNIICQAMIILMLPFFPALALCFVSPLGKPLAQLAMYLMIGGVSFALPLMTFEFCYQVGTDGLKVQLIREAERNQKLSAYITNLPKPKRSRLFDVREPGVYVIASPDGSYKIGCTSNKADRIHTFSVRLPFDPVLTVWLPDEDYQGLERQLHRKFSDKRGNGEWFALDDNDLEYLKDLAKQKVSK